jgi:hypothetical protein
MKKIDNFELMGAAARCGVSLESDLAHPVFAILAVPAGVALGLLPTAIDYLLSNSKHIEIGTDYIKSTVNCIY